MFCQSCTFLGSATVKPPFYHYVAEEVSCKLGCQWKCGKGYFDLFWYL